MKFIKHIFQGWFFIFTILFNVGIIIYFYQLFFNPQSFYDGMAVMGTIMALGIYTTYWLYCIKTFREKK